MTAQLACTTALPRITSIRTRAVLVPLRRPLIAGIGRFDDWPLVLVDVTVSGGGTGHAYVAPYRASAMRAVLAEIDDLSRSAIGAVASPFEQFEQGMHALNVIGLSGISTIAIAALDMALWDAMAREAGKPLAALLGGTPGPIKAYNSNGLWRHEVNTLGSEALALVAEGGFRAMKLRLGNEHLRDDLAAIDAVRQAVGDDIDLMVDFNQALGLGDAIRRCHELDEQGLYWFEEPIGYDDVSGYVTLAAKVRTPLQLGENHYGARDLLRFVEAGAIHYAMGDLMRIGGVTGWIRASAIAGAAGIQLSNHLYPELAAHLLRVAPSAHWLEYVDWAEPILANPLEVRGGMVDVSSAPGSGVDWNEAAVEKYLINP